MSVSNNKTGFLLQKNMRPNKNKRDVIRERLKVIWAKAALQLYYEIKVQHQDDYVQLIQVSINKELLPLCSLSEDQIEEIALNVLNGFFITLFFLMDATLEKPVFFAATLWPIFADKKITTTIFNVLVGENAFNENDTFIRCISDINNLNISRIKNRFDKYKDSLLRSDWSKLFSNDQTHVSLFKNMLQGHDQLAIVMSYIDHGNDIVNYLHKNPSQEKANLNFFIMESLIPYWVNRAVSKVEDVYNKLSKESRANLQKGKITNSLLIDFLAEGGKVYDATYQAFYRNRKYL